MASFFCPWMFFLTCFPDNSEFYLHTARTLLSYGQVVAIIDRLVFLWYLFELLEVRHFGFSCTFNPVASAMLGMLHMQNEWWKNGVSIVNLWTHPWGVFVCFFHWEKVKDNTSYAAPQYLLAFLFGLFLIWWKNGGPCFEFKAYSLKTRRPGPYKSQTGW